jgi:hypothetical protein
MLQEGTKWDSPKFLASLDSLSLSINPPNGSPPKRFFPSKLVGFVGNREVKSLHRYDLLFITFFRLFSRALKSAHDLCPRAFNSLHRAFIATTRASLRAGGMDVMRHSAARVYVRHVPEPGAWVDLGSSWNYTVF